MDQDKRWNDFYRSGRVLLCGSQSVFLWAKSLLFGADGRSRSKKNAQLSKPIQDW